MTTAQDAVQLEMDALGHGELTQDALAAIDSAGYELRLKEGGTVAETLSSVTGNRKLITNMPGRYLCLVEAAEGVTLYWIEDQRKGYVEVIVPAVAVTP